MNKKLNGWHIWLDGLNRMNAKFSNSSETTNGQIARSLFAFADDHLWAIPPSATNMNGSRPDQLKIENFTVVIFFLICLIFFVDFPVYAK